jgi:hypothetical protein
MVFIEGSLLGPVVALTLVSLGINDGLQCRLGCHMMDLDLPGFLSVYEVG